MKKEKLKIYTNETCKYCVDIKEGLKKENVEFEEVKIADNMSEWKNIFTLTGMPTVPTVFYKDNYFVAGRDFNDAKNLIELTMDFEKCTFPVELQILERLKTLNYGIATAFNRMDTTLRQVEANYRELFEEEETKTE